MPEKEKWINKLGAHTKLIISIVCGALAYLLLPVDFRNALQHVLTAWDFFCLIHLSLLWLTFFQTSSRQIRAQAQKQDDSRIVIFLLTLFAAVLSMTSVVLLLINSSGGAEDHSVDIIVGLSCMVLSWWLIHSIFAVRYAHLYYAKSDDEATGHAGGLDFPNEDHPDFLDFAYYAFTLGMTFQVSDVSVCSRAIRRLSLIHGLFSFAYNAAIIALSVNIISGLISG